MITLAIIYETINLLRDNAANAHMISCGGPLEYVDAYDIHGNVILAHGDGGPDSWLAIAYAPKRAEAARLAMKWHDVVRGCRTDADLHMRLAEHELDAVVKCFAADREAAE